MAKHRAKLHDRLRTGKYRAQPLRRIYIRKQDGRQRPISIPSLEDKIVQKAAADLLKTRMIEVGRTALARSEKPGGPKPVTFDFLGFTHICTRSRRGDFAVQLRIMRKRLRRSLKAVTDWCRGHRHDPVGKQQEELNRKLRGHYRFLSSEAGVS